MNHSYKKYLRFNANCDLYYNGVGINSPAKPLQECVVALGPQLYAAQQAKWGLARVRFVQPKLIEVLHRDPAKYGSAEEMSNEIVVTYIQLSNYPTLKTSSDPNRSEANGGREATIRPLVRLYI